MAWPKGVHKPKGPNAGRKKGTPNKATTSVKEALQYAFNGMGGSEAFLKWAELHPDEYYKLWIKMLPVDTNATIKGTINWPLPRTKLDE